MQIRITIDTHAKRLYSGIAPKMNEPCPKFQQKKSIKQKKKNIVKHDIDVLDDNPPLFPSILPFPRQHHQSASDPYAPAHPPERRGIALLAVAKDVTTASRASRLIDGRVDQSPHRCAEGWHRGDNSPIRSKVFNAPDHGNNDGRKAENSSITSTNQRRDYPESLAVVLDSPRSQSCKPGREQDCKEKQKDHARDGDTTSLKDPSGPPPRSWG